VLKTTVDLFKNQPMMAYCGTEWQICLNVAAGWFLTRKGILRI
jgi:hypothetical protein